MLVNHIQTLKRREKNKEKPNRKNKVKELNIPVPALKFHQKEKEQPAFQDQYFVMLVPHTHYLQIKILLWNRETQSSQKTLIVTRC